MSTIENIGTCRVCRGIIVKETITTTEFNPMFGPVIIGPGSEKQFKKTGRSEYYCKKCGLLYHPAVFTNPEPPSAA